VSSADDRIACSSDSNGEEQETSNDSFRPPPPPVERLPDGTYRITRQKVDPSVFATVSDLDSATPSPRTTSRSSVASSDGLLGQDRIVADLLAHSLPAFNEGLTAQQQQDMLELISGSVNIAGGSIQPWQQSVTLPPTVAGDSAARDDALNRVAELLDAASHSQSTGTSRSSSASSLSRTSTTPGGSPRAMVIPHRRLETHQWPERRLSRHSSSSMSSALMDSASGALALSTPPDLTIRT
jgi:hypothetical protein